MRRWQRLAIIGVVIGLMGESGAVAHQQAQRNLGGTVPDRSSVARLTFNWAVRALPLSRSAMVNPALPPWLIIASPEPMPIIVGARTAPMPIVLGARTAPMPIDGGKRQHASAK